MSGFYLFSESFSTPIAVSAPKYPNKLSVFITNDDYGLLPRCECHLQLAHYCLFLVIFYFSPLYLTLMSDNLQPRGADDSTFAQPLYTPIKRRSFFMYAGATAGATALVLAGCSKDSDPIVVNNNISLGAGDVGVLNYAYALEQLEAAFYAKVVALTASPLLTAEATYFAKMATHEAIHRDFLRTAINRDFSGTIIPDLTPKFDNIDFTKRVKAAADTKLGILDAAKAFEDLGVAAYNGAAKLLKSPVYLSIAGQIVSVEARHAAYVRDLITPGSFATNEAGDTLGFDRQLAPTAVLAIVQTYVEQTLNGSTIGQ